MNRARGQVDNSADDSGAVYLYTRSVTTWSQAAYVKASNTDASDSFGRGLSLLSLIAGGTMGAVRFFTEQQAFSDAPQHRSGRYPCLDAFDGCH